MLLLIGIVIGLVLGLTGAGGSVFAVPLLLVLAGLPMHQAVGLSLAAVAASAIFGSVRFNARQPVLWQPVALFSLTGMFLVPLGQWLGAQLTESLLIVGFTVLAVFIAAGMWRRAVQKPELASITRASDLSAGHAEGILCRFNPEGQFQLRPRCMAGLLAGGALVGMLSGLFGVGGGFLIVPLLLFLSQVTMRQAVSTSLVVISLISSIGFISFIVQSDSDSLPYATLFWLIAGAIIGMFAGQKLTARIADARLQKMFAVALLLMVVVMCLFHFYGG